MRLLFLILTALSVGIGTTVSAREPKPAVNGDIRDWAPQKPAPKKAPLAQPEAGHDLGSVSSDWARRQIHLSTNGADEQFMTETNEHLDRFFGVDSDENENSGAGGDRAPSSAGGAAHPMTLLRPRTVHMSRLGELELGFKGDAKLSCDFANGSAVNLTKPLFQDIDLRLHHESTVNSLQFQYSW